MILTYVPHLITLALCIAIVFSAIVNARMTLKYTRKDLLQILIVMSLGWQVATIVFFVINQTMWVVKSHEELVGTLSSTLWLIYDYTNKLFHLCCGMILYYYLRCRRDQRDITERDSLSCTPESYGVCPIIQTPELDEMKRQLHDIYRRREEHEKRTTVGLADPSEPESK